MLRVALLVIYYSVLKYLPSRSACGLCSKIRSLVVGFIFESSGRNLNVASGVRFGTGRRIRIGSNSGIGEGTHIYAMDDVVIGNDVMIGPQVMILTGSHDYKEEGIILRCQEIITAPVEVGNDVMLAARVILLPGVKVCDRVIVGAGSVVTKNIEVPGIYAGVPAKLVKRFDW